MPSFGWQLNDAQVAAVLNYLRNHWGSKARSISENRAMEARAALANRTKRGALGVSPPLRASVA
jgi:hypothetical protein